MLRLGNWTMIIHQAYSADNAAGPARPCNTHSTSTLVLTNWPLKHALDKCDAATPGTAPCPCMIPWPKHLVIKVLMVIHQRRHARWCTAGGCEGVHHLSTQVFRAGCVCSKATTPSHQHSIWCNSSPCMSIRSLWRSYGHCGA